MLSTYSLIALAVMAAAIAVGLSKRFLASGAIAIANMIVFALTVIPGRTLCTNGVAPSMAYPIHCELGLRGEQLAAGEPMAFVQLFSSMFVHADFLHLFGNLIVLFAFALLFEERVGHVRFVLIYLVTGLVAALAQLSLAWGEAINLMGASGAVFGIIGAFAGAYPLARGAFPMPLIVFMIFVRTQVWKAAAAFAGVQLVMQYLSGYAEGGTRVAYMAHLGGLAAGLVAGRVMVAVKPPKNVPQDEGHTHKPRAKPSVASLKPFAQDAKARNALRHLEDGLDEREVAMAWFERFMKSATCPECQQHVHPEGRDLVCDNQHRYPDALQT